MPRAVTMQAIGDWNKQMDVPLANALAASIELTGRQGRRAVVAAMVMMAQTARKLTRQSKKIRPVVKNPSDRWKTDRRVAPFGVMKYKEGKEVFAPIFRTGESGKYRFFDKKSMSWFEHHGSDKNKWVSIPSGPDPANPDLIVPGIMTDRRRKIGRSGLAKRSWMWGIREIRNYTDSGFSFLPGVAELSEFLGSNLCGMVMTNKLPYIMKAAPADVEDQAARAASNRIMAMAAKSMEKTYGVTVPRLAASRAKRAAKTLAQAYAEGGSL